MSENTNQSRVRTALTLGIAVLLLIVVFWGILFADTEITGAHTVALYYIEPFSENPETLSSGLGSTTPIIRSNIYATGISEHHARQTFALSIFSVFSQTPFREPVRLLIPIIFTAFGVIIILLFTKKEKTKSDVPKKILEYLSENPGASLSEIVRETKASRGSVVHHLRKLIRDREVHEIPNKKRLKYSIKGNNQDMMSIQKGTITKHPTTEKILGYLEKNTEVSRKQIGEDLGIPVSVVYWHLCRLEHLDMITRKKSGRSFIYSLNKK